MKGQISSIAKRIFFSLILPVCMYAFLCIVNPGNFMHFKTFIMMFTQCLPYVAIGWSMLFGMSVGLFDFSAGARIVLSGLGGILLSQSYGLWGFALGCLIVNIILSIIVGATYSYLKIPSIIAGFAGLLIFESCSVIIVKQMKNTISSQNLILGKSPYIYIFITIIFLITYFVYNNTKFGYQIKAIGGNEHVARSMGINSGRLKLLTYIIGGVFLGAATIIYVSYAGTVQPKDGMSSMNLCFTPMMGVMIGQLLTSCNPVIGTFIGELCITMVSSGMVALGIESRLQNVLVGTFLIIFMAFQINKNSDFVKKLTRKKTAVPAQ